ncbi:CueP family metal-binding protein [Nigerium massiliense]|uniref:CueP family metal-binding protein n=1 Tax=Nigerium massiliense TaxID=1522317 RepID=UPI0011C80682|nr:CueP family metal-binding protein [Nigerium massiliense]
MANDDGVLNRHGLEGLDTKQIIERLDRTNEDRNQVSGSVRGHELVLTDDQGTVTKALPEGQFYLSVAPFVSQTHDCFHHNLASCQGELVDKPLKVTITDQAGKKLVDEDVTTYDNGFAGFWLPADTIGTVQVSYDGKTGTAPFNSGADGASCMTDLRLS